MSPKRTAAREAFDLALLQQLHRGHVLPCGRWDDEPAWTAEDPARRRAAAVLCRSCPLQVECLAVGRQERHRFGVWGGRDFTTRKFTDTPDRGETKP